MENTRRCFLGLGAEKTDFGYWSSVLHLEILRKIQNGNTKEKVVTRADHEVFTQGNVAQTGAKHGGPEV